ncbi:hypothetical protein ZIOFF_043629 [Zingiber officinale]|uniref:Brix domain-containing protein n=1 Tax=Zingiber officinale TaxID=94328 RepID=A0A8J5FWY2_ZINOF|nr:hypothetical protein ZIOFF_043629 [Zingiber officinale]
MGVVEAGDTRCNPSSQIWLLALTLAAFPLSMPPRATRSVLLTVLLVRITKFMDNLNQLYVVEQYLLDHQSAKEQRWVCNELGLVSYLGSKAMASSKDDVDEPTDSYSLQVLKNPYKDPDDGRQQFLLELEFVQCLANPTYIHIELSCGFCEVVTFPSFLIEWKNATVVSISIFWITLINVFSFFFIEDEYATASEKDPKILLTTSPRMNRGSQVISEIIEFCRAHEYTDVIFVHEHRGEPDNLVICHLPFGPTAFFELLNVAPRAWYFELRAFLVSLGFIVSRADTSLFVYSRDDTVIYFLVYVDDLIIKGSDASSVDVIVCKLHAKFTIKDLGALSLFCGVEVRPTSNDLLLS